MVMRSWHGVVLLGLLVAAGCAGSRTKLTQVWYDPDHGGPIENVLVLGVLREQSRQRDLEERIALRFTNLGIRATPGIRVIPPKLAGDEKAIRTAVDAGGFDTVLLARLVGVGTRKQHIPGETYVDNYWGDLWYDYYPYYASSWAIVHEPGYTIERTVVSLETNVYDVESGSLIWAGLSETVDPTEVSDAIEDFSYVVIGDLVKNGIIEKRK